MVLLAPESNSLSEVEEPGEGEDDAAAADVSLAAAAKESALVCDLSSV